MSTVALFAVTKSPVRETFIGLAVGGITAAVTYNPPWTRGAALRVLHRLGFGCVVLLLIFGWAGTLGFDPVVHRNTGLAAGLTVGVGLVMFWRTRRGGVREPREPSETNATGPRQSKPGSRRARSSVIAIDYVIGATACTVALFGGAYLIKAARPAVMSRFHSWGPLEARVATEALLLSVGFVMSQLVSTAAFIGLNTALGRDWKISRRWRYVLLAPPFVLCLPLAFGAPGLLLGSATHLSSLYVGLRWTDRPPTTPYKTLKYFLREGPRTSAYDLERARMAAGPMASRRRALKAASRAAAWGLLTMLSSFLVLAGIIDTANGVTWHAVFSLIFAPTGWLAGRKTARAWRARQPLHAARNV